MMLRWVGVSLVLALGACTHMMPGHASSPPQTAAAAAPSPRPDCAPAHVTLYFSQEVASDEPVATPLLNEFMNRIHACETAGGELRSVTITTSADPGQSSSDARAQIQRRQDRVKAALVNLGVPQAKIRGATTPEASVMGRRAEIDADLY
jgi:hypothetical protein